MIAGQIKLLLAAALTVILLVGGITALRPTLAKPATPSTGLHVYLCQSGKPIQQVINCDNGESVLLTADLANELALSTKELDK